MDYTIFDIEADELRDKVTIVHCFSWWRSDGTSGTITDMSLVKPFCDSQNILVGHNIKRYDNPVIKKILGFDVLTRCIDTLPLSWYLHPDMKQHGLEIWGDILGVAKPVITDWSNLALADYVHRCETDVVINKLLFQKFIRHLLLIYGNQSIDSIMDYLTYKMDCASEQEDTRLRIDRQHCETQLHNVTTLVEEKAAILQSHMPRQIKYIEKVKPEKMYLKPKKATDPPQLSVKGAEWLELLFDNGLPADYEGAVRLEKSNEPGNPNSVPQLKTWLFSSGWYPTLFDYKKHTAGEIKAIPQLSDKDGNICLNIQTLFEQYPYLEELKSFSMLKHRQGVFKGFLECADEQGFMKAEIAGLTNTLRFKHTKPIANLPGVHKPYGREIRGAIVRPSEEYLFCGSDMSSLEDSTKQHYMYYYDPDYVMQMRVPGFDPHIDIGLLADMLTQIQADRFKYLDGLDRPLTPDEKLELSGLKKIRGKAKIVNFSGIYGAGPAKIALTTGMTLEEATLLHKIYWERNKAVKQVCRDITVKVILKSGGTSTYLGRELLGFNRTQQATFMQEVKEMWLYNPVSKFWYSLRYFKDIFSTLNQGTGVYCFDTWVRFVRNQGIKIALQYHDEIGFPFLKDQVEQVKEKLTLAIKQTNDLLKLNVPLGISIDIGTNYADTH